jgi:tetratricopeptide (TPR) repeat protein
MSTAEQAQIFMAQGYTCRAVALYRKIIRTTPSAENLTMLAEIYMQQGLHEDAIELHLRVVKMGLKA